MAITLKNNAKRLNIPTQLPTALSYGLKPGIFKHAGGCPFPPNAH
jgi:hypothetical protein